MKVVVAKITQGICNTILLLAWYNNFTSNKQVYGNICYISILPLSTHPYSHVTLNHSISFYITIASLESRWSMWGNIMLCFLGQVSSLFHIIKQICILCNFLT